MNGAAHLATGEAGEQRALDFLVGRGLVPLARNFRCREGELDLVMRDGEELVIVEVRYRRSQRFGGAAASVDGRKQRKIVRATQRYVAARGISDTTPIRFDVVAISRTGADGDIQWIRDAFQPGAY